MDSSYNGLSKPAKSTFSELKQQTGKAFETASDAVSKVVRPLFPKMGDNFESNLNSAPKSTPPVLMYPIDLGSSSEYQFSLRFDIFQTGGANLQRNRRYQDYFSKNIQDAIGQNKGNLSLKQGLNIAAQVATPFIDLVAIGPSSTVIGSSNAGPGSYRDTFVEEEMGIQQLTEHVASVYMYLPGSINISYKMDYEDANLSSLEIAKALRSLTETQTADSGALQSEIARKIGMSVMRGTDQLMNVMGGEDFVIKGLEARTRQVENPFVVHLFKGVGRRTFRFAFTMVPRSEKEAIAIDNIVTMFRKYSHPKRSKKGRFLDFPAEFTVAFLYRNQENIRLPKLRKCAVTGINLTYGEGMFTATKPDANGKVSPTKVTMELELSELEILTQDTITDQGA